jgi:putative spermidine/putrescine transport system substrate-binding protein
MSQEQELFSQLLTPHNRRDFIKRAGALGLSGAALTAFLEACGSNTGAGGTTPTASVNLSGPIDMQTLITKAKAEGGLQAVGIPPEWADYKDMLANYASMYVPIDYKADAEFTSAQEVQVFTESKKHAYGDIADVGFKWGPVVIQQDLVSPYKHSYWNDIPAKLKDPNGNWCVEYWGAQSFVINTDKVKNPPTRPGGEAAFCRPIQERAIHNGY